MAPEQLAGKEVSVRSDLYSLGLVLYELFVGKPAFRSGSLAEHVRMHEQGATPTSPSTLVEGFDPVVERVILRCLEKEPRNRPPSALAVSAALPGGDPLAAALAAGEMPSPEMVAAAGEVGSLTPAAAWACLASVIAGTILLAVMVSGRSGARQLSREDPPEVLASKAREMIGGAGYTDPPRDRAYGFYEDEDYLRYVREHDKSVRRWDEVQAGHPAAIVFWYRQSPRYLEPVTFPMLRPQQISRDDPPPIESGMTGVLLDPQSRLIGFYAVPPQVDEPQATSPPPDWKILFTAAGLDASGFKPVTPQWTPPVWSDTREAWEGFLPGRRDLPLRIEAASYRGRPVYFEVVRPWTRPERMQRSSNSGGEVAAQIFLLTLFIGIVIGGAVLARRNLKLGRGDRRGAARIALFIFAVSLLAWIIGGAHVPTFYEAGLFVMAVSWALFSAALVSVVYLALEPSVRRRWPDVLISWSRVLAGRLRDPLVGRDLLVGCLIPIALLFISYGAKLLSVWRGLPQPAPTIGNTAFLGGIRQGAGSIAGSVALSVFVGLTIVFLLFVLRTILRRQWLAGAAFVVIFTIPTMTSADDLLLRIPVAVSLWTLTVIALMRFGVFSVMTLFFCGPLLGTFLLVGDPSAWYAGRAFLPLAVYFALAVYGFHTALAGQPLFRERPAA
jgi:serine/threonine-protein kinase